MASYGKRRKEGNVLFNDALNTFYLRLYGRKEIFYLMTHSTHFIYGYMEGRKEGNILFNDALNTFYLRLYGRKEGNILFNDALNTFYLWLYGRKEGNVLFNDTLNTFYLRLYGFRHMVKDNSDTERRNPLPPYRLLFSISSKVPFICIIPQTG